MGRMRAALVSCLFIAIMEAVAWGMMVFSRSDVPLTAMGLHSLRYFTVLSNLLLGLASLIYAAFIARALRRGAPIPLWAHALKFAATVAVTVTLMTVLLFLGPTMGYAAMFAGANLWLHLVLPVIGIVEFVFFDVSLGLPFAATLLGALPTFLYGLGYWANILMNGLGSGMATNDWYGFATWGVERLPLVLLVMLALSWLFAVAIRAGNAAVRKRA